MYNTITASQLAGLPTSLESYDSNLAASPTTDFIDKKRWMYVLMDAVFLFRGLQELKLGMDRFRYWKFLR
jgi:hypothetical protein